ncbi:basal body-orientation factor 1-like [Oscarella lobularis]|uniref:basal body-orientation factor 1-like n=1 Tax=Oscarella lobularis TaxID=121494 RepID=UPI0033143C4D
MPAKKGKGKKKGGGKKKKGKKEKTPKSEKEIQYKEALTNAKIWEARLEATEKSRQEYKENLRKLVGENDDLKQKMGQNEKDTVEVLAFMKREETAKEDKVSQLQLQLKDLRRDARLEKERLGLDFSAQFEALELTLHQKEEEVQLMQVELKQVKEFRRKRAQMQQEMDDIRLSMESMEREHKETLIQMEERFFQEKARLQQEASRKVEDLASRAHEEAVKNLDATTKAIYKENVQLNEALKVHLMETENQGKLIERLSEENARLQEDKNLDQLLVQEKVSEAKKHKTIIKRLQSKVENLEKSLTQAVREFEYERDVLRQRTDSELRSTREELARLKRQMELKDKEMNHVKLLAKQLLEQRSDVENFFLEALAHVKKEIIHHRNQYKRDAHLAYQRNLAAAQRGEGEFPRVRTFRLMETSTNSVYKDIEKAEGWDFTSGKVDVSELTWEQKESVLRFLFAKMNTAAKKPTVRRKPFDRSLVPLEASDQQAASSALRASPEPDGTTFVTQQDAEENRGPSSSDKYRTGWKAATATTEVEYSAS